jgi:carboxypeptidase C (cathepsin A)
MSPAFNNYVRGSLRYEPGIDFKSGISIYDSWDYKHKPPGGDRALIALPNVLPDLAVAMKQNPDLKVMVNGGYYDVSTPYFRRAVRDAAPADPGQPQGQYRVSLL